MAPTMGIAILYGTRLKQIERHSFSSGTTVTALMMSPFKVRTTARVFNMMPLLNPLPISPTTHVADRPFGVKIQIEKHLPMRRSV